MGLSWRIAYNFLRDGRVQTLLIIVGVAVGAAVIVFITALVDGLQGNIVQRTLGTQAHIVVSSPDLLPLAQAVPPGTVDLRSTDARPQRLRSINNWPGVLDVLQQLDGVTAASPVVTGPAFAQRGAAVRAVAVIGIVPQRYVQVIPVNQDMVQGRFNVGASQILIGNRLAQDLGLRVGDKLRVQGASGGSQVFDVAGVFSLGVRDLDQRYVYMGLKPAQALLGLPGGVTEIDLTVRDIFRAEAIAARINRLTGLKSESWMTTNGQLLNALKSQSLSSALIRFFVALSVAFGIASVLAVSVVQRTREIGILRAMGATRQRILAVFLYEGAAVGFAGSVLGAAAGAGMVWVFNTYGPALFYVPVAFSLVIEAVVVATLAGIAAAALPAMRAAGLDPVVAIRYV
uniref:Putative ABC-type antimicrobial peptide transport system, permease component n=1 Tax=mine drainage metagenome TaxID=410659 RepID=E6PW48_9ZZZZ